MFGYYSAKNLTCFFFHIQKKMYFQLLQNWFTTTLSYGILSFLPHSTKGIRYRHTVLIYDNFLFNI
jgi:hypothetical protein